MFKKEKLLMMLASVVVLIIGTHFIGTSWNAPKKAKLDIANILNLDIDESSINDDLICYIV